MDGGISIPPGGREGPPLVDLISRKACFLSKTSKKRFLSKIYNSQKPPKKAILSEK